MTTDGVQMQGAQQSGGKDVAGGPTQEVATEQALLSPSTAAEPGVRLPAPKHNMCYVGFLMFLVDCTRGNDRRKHFPARKAEKWLPEELLFLNVASRPPTKE
jgi:hypothetical protein